MSLASRQACIEIGRAFLDSGSSQSFSDFVRWLRFVDPGELSLPEDQVVAVLSKLAHTTARSDAREVLRTGSGTISAQLRGLDRDGQQIAKDLRLPAPLELSLDSTAGSGQAVRVTDVAGNDLGYLSSEVSGPVLHLLRDDDYFAVDATLVALDAAGGTGSLVLSVASVDQDEVPF